MTPPPCICCKPCPVLASFSALCGSMTSMTLTASHGCRILSLMVAWSRLPRNWLANAWTLRARTAGTPTSRGPFPQLLQCFCARIQRGKNARRLTGHPRDQPQSSVLEVLPLTTATCGRVGSARDVCRLLRRSAIHSTRWGAMLLSCGSRGCKCV
jgi:hypothetical protein